MHQQTAARTVARVAPVLSLADHRAARVRRKRRSIPVARPLVALWFGTAVFAVVLLLGFAASVALRTPSVGIPAGLVVASAACWHAAGAWLTQRRATVEPAPPARRRSL